MATTDAYIQSTAVGNQNQNVGPLVAGIGPLTPLPQAPKNPTVVTGQTAQNTLNTIQGNTNTITQAVQTQAQNRNQQAAWDAVGAKNQAQYDQIVAQSKQANQTASDNAAKQVAALKQASDALLNPYGTANGQAIGNPNPNYYPNGTTSSGAQITSYNPDGSVTDANGQVWKNGVLFSGTQTGTQTGTQQGTQTGSTSGTTSGTTNNTTDYTEQIKDVMSKEDQALASFQDSMRELQNGTFPLTGTQQMLLSNTQTQYQQAIEAQKLANANLQGGVTSSNISSGLQRYAPNAASSNLSATIAQGVQAIAKIETDASTALAKLEEGFQTDDLNLVKDSYDAFTNAMNSKTAELQKMQDASVAAQKDARDFIQTTVTKPIQDISTNAAKNGAPQSVIDKINSAKTVADAIQASVGYATDPTSNAGMYSAYVKSQTDSGKTPMSAGDFLAAKDYKDAYNKSLATEKAKLYANTDPNNTNNNSGLIDINSQSILAQTGLSIQAFNYLTQGTSSLSRLSAQQRTAIMNEASNFLNKNGLDYSTFQSQYKAYNNALQQNIERANNTKIFAGEVAGTANQFLNDIGDDFGKLKLANVAKVLAGQQVNDPLAQKYAFDLQSMQNDLAGYYAASRGSTSPDNADLEAAAGVIKNGINGGSITAFRDSITANEEKVSGVVNSAVDSAKKQVWDQFGIGDKFKGSNQPLSTDQAMDQIKTSVTDYYSKASDKDVNLINNAIQKLQQQKGRPLDYSEQDQVIQSLASQLSVPYKSYTVASGNQFVNPRVFQK